MGESKHTPGPWAKRRNTNGHGGKLIEIYGTHGRRVAAINWTMANPEADADLIAAAPLMLDAYEHILSALAAPGSAESKLEVIREHARAAIKAATGGEL